ncbi:MAG TPA: hypothetical protein VFV41_02455, partial [Streptosporangiaceae bacterium]|nr:hypothetical protein [Streptosporangiaceae bacterium]
LERGRPVRVAEPGQLPRYYVIVDPRTGCALASGERPDTAHVQLPGTDGDGPLVVIFTNEPRPAPAAAPPSPGQ